MANNILEHCQRVVIKVGSDLLLDRYGQLKSSWLRQFIEECARLQQQSLDIIIVTAGSILLGRSALGFTGKTLQIKEQQAAASIGQVRLASIYQAVLSEFGLVGGQLLLTLEDFDSACRYMHARNTLKCLLEHHAIAVINENDTVATETLKAGDNDCLAAKVAQMVEADLLIDLCSFDGVYSRDGQGEPTLLSHINTVTKGEDYVLLPPDESHTALKRKLEAASFVTQHGCHMLLGNGKKDAPLYALLEGKTPSTIFKSQVKPHEAFLKWLASHRVEGTLTLTNEAAKALNKGSSVLLAALTLVEGNFSKGSVVKVVDAKRNVLALGLTDYSSKEIQCLLGKQSHEITDILGYADGAAIIHRDNLWLKEA